MESDGYQHYLAYGSAWNDPAFLLAAVLQLRETGVALDQVRIIPHIGHIAQPEIVSRPLQEGVGINAAGDDLHGIYLNIRSQNRLHWLYPLFHQGPVGDTLPGAPLPGPDAQLRKLAEQKAEEIWKELIWPNLEPNQQEMECLDTHQWLIDGNPEWIKLLGFIPTDRGGVQPGYTTPVQWLARLWRTLYPELTPVPQRERPHPYRLRLVGSQFILERNPNQTIRVRDDRQAGQLRDDATVLAERFFTLAFLHLASIEMLEGVAYPADWTFNPLGNPFHYGMAEPGRKFEKNGLLGGLDLDGVLLWLMQDWKNAGTFLGLTREDWALFKEPAEQGALWMLLLKRRSVSDWGALFERAVHLLISEQAKVCLETYRGVDSVLGKLLAQPGLSLVLEGEPILRAPEVIVYLPHDRSTEPEAGITLKRLEILRRLFLPAHIPLRSRWMVDQAALDETAWLADEDGRAPEGWFPLQSYMANGE